ncbi:MAG TPA: rod shape-determining protein [Limnochordales bacterium]|nr:rod shape-determining protein [Limnochordales bacterium]
MFGRDIGIDMGTANVLIFMRGKGLVMQEPSVIAVDQETNRVLAIGEEARRMIGRTPGNIVAIRPLKAGVIADYTITEIMLKYLIRRVLGRRPLWRPQIAVCVPSGVTTVEQRAVIEACMQAGAKKVCVISEPMAAALGAGLNIVDPGGNMVVDIGGGTTDVAVISMGGEVVADSLRLGGDDLDEAIIRYVRREFNLLVGEATAEEIKRRLGCVYDPDESVTMEVRGRDTVTGLPRAVRLSEVQVHEALQEPIQATVNMIRTVLEKTPPELAGDIISRGIVLTGGGALLKGLPELIRLETRVPATVADDPLTCVARGTGRVLEEIHRLPTDTGSFRVS